MSILLLEWVELFQRLDDRSYIPIDCPEMRYRMLSRRLRRVEVVGWMISLSMEILDECIYCHTFQRVLRQLWRVVVTPGW